LTYFGELGDKVVGADLVHFDVMDNHFVPNLTVGPMVAASLAAAIDLPIDAHLQMTNPDNLIPSFAEAGVASIAVQPEVVTHLHRTLGLIRSLGCEAGVALNPTSSPELIQWALPFVDYINVMSVNPGFGGQDFIPEMVEKVRRLKDMTDVPIEVDGGITVDTAPLMVEAGAQVLIAGSAVFRGDPATEMRKIIESGLGAT
jgi:ribulose-phosphate 3-epimerase